MRLLFSARSVSLKRNMHAQAFFIGGYESNLKEGALSHSVIRALCWFSIAVGVGMTMLGLINEASRLFDRRLLEHFRTALLLMPYLVAHAPSTSLGYCEYSHGVL